MKLQGVPSGTHWNIPAKYGEIITPRNRDRAAGSSGQANSTVNLTLNQSSFSKIYKIFFKFKFLPPMQSRPSETLFQGVSQAKSEVLRYNMITFESRKHAIVQKWTINRHMHTSHTSISHDSMPNYTEHGVENLLDRGESYSQGIRSQ